MEISSDYNVDWYRVKLSPEQLEELNRRSNARGFLQAGGYLLTVSATGGLAIYLALIGAWWWLVPALLLHGTVSGFHINAVHELVHGTVFRTPWLNKLFAAIFAFLGWANHHGFWASHKEHHLYTLHDPHDQEEVVPITYTLKGFLSTVFNPFALINTIRDKTKVALGIQLGAWQKHLLDGQERRFVVYRWARCLLIGHALVIAVSLWYGLWIIPVVVTCTPAYGRTLLFLLNNTQHVGMQDHVSDFRLNCRTIHVNPLFRFLYWHMNWHIEHHMYAAVPCYRLHTLHKLIKHELPPTPRGLAATWSQIIHILYKQKEEPGWQFQPRLPGDGPNSTSSPRVKKQPRSASAATTPTELRKVWQCSVCGFIYDEAIGMPEDCIAPGTAWNDIPEGWRCPDCGVAKAEFAMSEIARPVQTTAEPVPDAEGHEDPIVILGSGLAAYTVAREYRRLSPDQQVVLLTRDAGHFYSKPMLSNALAERQNPDDLIQKDRPTIADELNLDVRNAVTVSAIDRAAQEVCWGDERLRYSRLVLALGADQIQLPFAGDAVDTIHRVNDLDDYSGFRDALPAGGSVVIIGGGLIGCEFANDLISAGYQVHVVDLADWPLASLLPQAVGTSLQTRLADLGVDWHLTSSISSIDHADNKIACSLSDGTIITADVVLSAVGLRPRTELATQAGLDTGRGISVDAELRTSDPTIFAIGDCAEQDGSVRPFILPIMHGAKAMAQTLAGRPQAVTYPLMPVLVKTPALPLLIVPPAPGQDGEWQVETTEAGQIARYHDTDGTCRGLALTGDTLDQRDTWLAEMQEHLLSATSVA